MIMKAFHMKFDNKTNGIPPKAPKTPTKTEGRERIPGAERLKNYKIKLSYLEPQAVSQSENLTQW